jgi:hypothetical protein
MNTAKIAGTAGIFLPVAILIVASLAFGQAEGEDIGWPRQIDHPEGKVIIYQPQIDSFKGDILESRAAVSVTKKGSDAPVFGAAWFRARVQTDRDARLVHILDIEVPRVRFPEATPEQEKQLIDFLEKEIPKWEIPISLDRVIAGLDLAEKDQLAADNFKNAPPKILVVNEPAVLILIDGDPKLEQVEDSKMQYVVNTPFLIVRHKNTYYLNGGQLWMEANDVLGPWKESKRPPKDVKKLTPPEEEGVETFGEVDGRIPRIIVSREPAELIVIDGAPDYKPIEGNDLLYVENTESDVLMNIKTQQHFILLSGRWYASTSLTEGSWKYVASDELPEAFAEIAADSENGHLRVHVAGTDEAKEAILDAQVPQTSAIKRDSEGPKVEYDGEPQFETVKGTSGKVENAVNTPSSVFKVSGNYYCCHEAVWYIAGGAQGPWSVCDDVPDEIYTIPPDNPHYNVKYVRVYESTPEVVYVGYYPGYMGSYVYGPTIVYGTGWWYRPWYGRWYYPRPYTWGFHVRWNPWYGWSFGLSFGRGPFRLTVGFGGYGGWWGPGRYRPYPYRGGVRHAYRAGYRHGYYRGARAGYRAGARPTPYGAQNRSNIYNRQSNAVRNAQRAQPANRARPNVAPGQSNNVFADRNGNIHRQNQSGQWQSRQNGQWSSGQAGTRDRVQPQRQARPSTGSSQSQLNRQAQARQRGSARSQNFQSSRSRSTAPRRRR